MLEELYKYLTSRLTGINEEIDTKEWKDTHNKNECTLIGQLHELEFMMQSGLLHQLTDDQYSNLYNKISEAFKKLKNVTCE